METKTLTLPNVERVLKEYANSAGDIYRSCMAELGKDASGALSNSARAEVRVDGTRFEVVMHLEEYWKYIESGRKPGKFPPPDKIREWIEVKPVLPRPMENGKLPTIKQLSYLIGRKIAIKGIPPTPILETTVSKLNEQFLDKLYRAIREDIGYILKSAIHSAF